MNPVKKAVVSAISWYCTHSPIEPGKTRLQKLGLRVIADPVVTARSRTGHNFVLHFPEDHGFDHIYWRGTYETGTLEVLQRVVGPDDVVLDVGANMGWYTVHLATFAPRGVIHAFEPMPPTFDRLVHNCEINGSMPRVILNKVALGDHHGDVTLHSFANLGHGHSSLSTLGRKDFTEWRVRMTTLDSYLHDAGAQRVDVVKMDVEGAEVGVVRGASSLFSLESPPIWIVEMNDETSASFGHKPPDLLSEITRHGEYSLFRIERSWGDVLPMRSIDDYVHGDNAVCVPHSRLDHWRRTVGVV